jgi:hypothetical protein
MPFLRPFDDYECAVYLRCRGNVEQQGFPCGRRDEDRRIGQHCLEFGKSFFSLEGPREVFGFLQETIQREHFFVEARDEAIEGQKATRDLLYAL